MFLTDEQLAQLTGTKQPRLMIKWLRAEGFTFRINRSGWPVVSAQHVNEVLNGGVRTSRRKPEVQLDWLEKEKA